MRIVILLGCVESHIEKVIETVWRIRVGFVEEVTLSLKG